MASGFWVHSVDLALCQYAEPESPALVNLSNVQRPPYTGAEDASDGSGPKHSPSLDKLQKNSCRHPQRPNEKVPCAPAPARVPARGSARRLLKSLQKGAWSASPPVSTSRQRAAREGLRSTVLDPGSCDARTLGPQVPRETTSPLGSETILCR